jgi:nucleoside-diphosphate-sugar epimerase
MKYFVTGATGFIGGVVARKLAAQGHEVITLARSPEKAGDLKALGIAVHKGDITEKETLQAPMTGVDGVFHIAGWYKIGVKDKSVGQRINVDGTRNVLEVMRDLGIHKGVYTSTLAINSDTHGKEVDESYHFTGTHISEYDRTKAAAHDVAESFIKQGLPLVIVMPGLVYGIGDTSSTRTTFIQYLQGKLPLLPLGTAFSWGHIDDIADAHLLAMEKGRSGEKYIIAGPTHTLVEGMELAEKITGVRTPAIRATPGVMRVSAGLMGVLENVISVPETFASETLRVTAGVTYIGSNAKARRELGYNPRPLEQGLREWLPHEMKLLGMTPKASF